MIVDSKIFFQCQGSDWSEVDEIFLIFYSIRRRTPHREHINPLIIYTGQTDNYWTLDESPSTI